MKTSEEANVRSPSPWAPTDPVVDPERKAALLHLMLSNIKHLKRTLFYERFLLQLRSPEVANGLDDALKSATGSHPSVFNMVVYGIGSIKSSLSSRLQLSLALLLHWELSFSMSGSLELFDPVLSATECAVATELGFKVATANENGHKQCQLYYSLLQTNWRSPAPRQMVILGNSFEVYETIAELGQCRDICEFGSHVLRTREMRLVRELDMTCGGRLPLPFVVTK